MVYRTVSCVWINQSQGSLQQYEGIVVRGNISHDTRKGRSMFGKKNAVLFLLCAATMTAALSGCPSLFGQASFISASPKTVDFGENETVMKFRVSFGGTGRALEWSLRVDTAGADAWMSVSPMSCDGIHEVTITVDRSKITKDEEATIVVTDENEGTTSVKVIVRKEKPAAAEGEGEDSNKEGEAAPTTPVLSVSPTRRDVSSAAGNTTFNIANTGVGTMNWTAQVTSGDWLQIMGDAAGGNNGVISINYEANDNPNSRTGSIQITADGAAGSPKTVTVVQAGFQEPITQPILEVTPAQRNVAAAAGNATFSIANIGVGTMNWTAAVTAGNWLRITSLYTGTNNGAITVAYDANAAAAARTGAITVTAPGTVNSPTTVSIVQAATGGGETSEVEGSWYTYLEYDEEEGGVYLDWMEFEGNSVWYVESLWLPNENKELSMAWVFYREGTYSSNAGANPKQIDINFTAYGEEDIWGTDESGEEDIALTGIYKFDQGDLVMAANYDGVRPTSFSNPEVGLWLRMLTYDAIFDYDFYDGWWYDFEDEEEGEGEGEPSYADDPEGWWISYWEDEGDVVYVSWFEFFDGNQVESVDRAFLWSPDKKLELISEWVFSGTYTANISANPMQVNFTFTNNYQWDIEGTYVNESVNLPFLGIYKFDQGNLVLAADSQSRPTSFTNPNVQIWVRMLSEQQFMDYPYDYYNGWFHDFGKKKAKALGHGAFLGNLRFLDGAMKAAS